MVQSLDWDLIMCKEKSRSQGMVGYEAERGQERREEGKSKISIRREKKNNKRGWTSGRKVSQKRNFKKGGGERDQTPQTDNEKLRGGPTYRMFPSETGTVVDYAQASQTWS